MKVFVAAALTLVASSSALASFSFELLNPELRENLGVQRYLQHVESLLPNTMKGIVNHKVKVRFEDLSAKKEGMKGLVKKGFLGSSKSADTILLDNSVLEMLGNPRVDSGNNHQSNYRYAVGILAHEVAHLYDFKGALVGADLEMFRACRQDVVDRVASRRERRLCERLLRRKRTISDSPLFLNLAGWNKTGLIIKKRKQYNQNLRRSPDPYELKNKQEFFAVNFEFFLLDEAYKCRRPNLYNYFKKAFDLEPFPGADCKMSTKILMSQEAWQGKNPRFADVDPARVYQIHYLFAGEGKAIMSRWGHSMVRIVTCSPRRETVGPECLNDLAYHVVLSFRANIADTTMSYLAGLNGKYDSMMFILSLNDVVEEYTKGEFRDVFSVPIPLSEVEKRDFLNTALEQYWGYRGSYYFITNNCSTETAKLIRLAFQEDVELQDMTVVTPLELFNKLAKRNISNMSVFEDEDEAVRRGYLFKGMHKKLDQAYKELIQNGIALPYENYEEYVKNSTALERRDALAQVERIADRDSRKIALARLMKLEGFIGDRSKILFMEKLADYVFKKEQEGSLDDSLVAYIDDFQRIQQSMLPEKTVQGGYGIPLEAESRDIDARMMKEIQDGITDIGSVFLDWAKDRYPEDLEEMRLTGENKRLILKKFRAAL